MSEDDRVAELVAAFRELGAQDPEGSARAELRGDPELARVAFARCLWDEVQADGSTRWRKSLGWPEMTARLDRLLSGKGTEADLGAVIRQVAVNTMMSLVGMLDYGEPYEHRFKQLPKTPRWSVFETNEYDEPMGAMESWQELVMNLDPSGRMANPPADDAEDVASSAGATASAPSKKVATKKVATKKPAATKVATKKVATKKPAATKKVAAKKATQA